MVNTMKQRAVLVFVFCLVAGGLCSGADDPVSVLKSRIQATFSRLSQRPARPVPDYNLGSLWEVFPWDPPSPVPRDVCSTCSATVTAVLDAYHVGVPPQVIKDVILFNCKEFHIRPPHVCDDIVEMTYPPMLYIVEHTANLTSDRVCAIVHQGSHCGADDPSTDWSIDLGDEPPPPDTLPAQQAGNSEPLHILQLTDIHFDPLYKVGSNVDCEEGYCCRDGEPATPEAAAGLWGSYKGCDIPWDVITDTLTHVKAQHKIDYVYMTGDIIDHATWDTTREKNVATLTRVMTELKTSLGDIPVFPIAGNHEPHPFNLYAPASVTQPDVSSTWLYEALAGLWSAWLPPDARPTVLRGGFYTALARPGLRVVALNNNHCYTDDYWLVHDGRDPDGQLQWLADTLREAERAGERVHLLYHVPTGGADCYKRWSREFARIVNRYHKTITGQFSGHTHNDEFRVFYSSEEPSRPIATVHVGGSLTPFTDINGNYRMYSVDPDTLEVLDFETWIFNLTAANAAPAGSPLPWELLYSFAQAYGEGSPTPDAVDAIARRMAGGDRDLVQQYFRFFNLNGDPQLEGGCDDACMEGMICSIVTADSNDLSHCREIVDTWRANRATAT